MRRFWCTLALTTALWSCSNDNGTTTEGDLIDETDGTSTENDTNTGTSAETDTNTEQTTDTETDEPSPDCPPAFAKALVFETTLPNSSDSADVYYPDLGGGGAPAGGFPVGLFLQGGTVDKSYYSHYAAHVARYGFIIVVPNHFHEMMPGTEGFYPESKQTLEIVSWMKAENSRNDSPIAGIVDTTRFAAMGHSHGAGAASMAVQSDCMFPFCAPDETIERPVELQVGVFTGFNTKPPVAGYEVQPLHNGSVPIAIINGELDGNAQREDTLDTFEQTDNPPKLLVFVKGANHYGVCDQNNPPGPHEEAANPTLDQSTAVETSARWSALFMRAHLLEDACANSYVYELGAGMDDNVEVTAEH